MAVPKNVPPGVVETCVVRTMDSRLLLQLKAVRVVESSSSAIVSAKAVGHIEVAKYLVLPRPSER